MYNILDLRGEKLDSVSFLFDDFGLRVATLFGALAIKVTLVTHKNISQDSTEGPNLGDEQRTDKISQLSTAYGKCYP